MRPDAAERIVDIGNAVTPNLQRRIVLNVENPPRNHDDKRVVPVAFPLDEKKQVMLAGTVVLAWA